MTLPNPPSLIHQLDVFNNIVRIKGDFIITLCVYVNAFAQVMYLINFKKGTCM